MRKQYRFTTKPGQIISVKVWFSGWQGAYKKLAKLTSEEIVKGEYLSNYGWMDLGGKTPHHVGFEYLTYK